MSTRRDGPRRYDHGAQYFTVRDRRFARWVESWVEEGRVARWEGRIATLAGGRAKPKPSGPERYVGVPGMSAMCRHLATDLEVVTGTRVTALERRGRGWRLSGEDGAELGSFDAVVVSAPAPQTAELLAAAAPELAARAAGVEMSPCWAAMASFAGPVRLAFDGAFVEGSPLSWIARDSSKPGRPEGEAWVLHASPEWTRSHLELEPEAAAERLLAAFVEAAGVAEAKPVHLEAHRWRFALPEPLAEPCLFDAAAALAACGDWCGGPRVEGAFLSGCAAAGRLLSLAPPPAQASLFDDGR